ncbi:MAG: hemerythrin domain-containing protein [Pseudonocardia sp.]
MRPDRSATITDFDLTIMLAMHDAFRRDLGYLAAAAARFRGADPQRRNALVTGYELFTYQLRHHAMLEDRHLWPQAAARLAASPHAVAVLGEMEAEHAELDPALAAVNAAIAAADIDPDVDPDVDPDADPGADPDAAHRRLTDAAGALTGVLRDHLLHEEREALPLLKQSITRREWLAVGRVSRKEFGLRGTAQYFPWLLDGADPDRSAQVLSLLPAPVRVAYRRRWNPVYHRSRRWS